MKASVWGSSERNNWPAGAADIHSSKFGLRHNISAVTDTEEQYDAVNIPAFSNLTDDQH